jgi:hypothetical protein
MRFDQQLSAILENASRLRPASIMTVRGVEIIADHARWIKSPNGKIYLAAGLKSGGKEYIRTGRSALGPMHEMRDFYAPRHHTMVGDDENGWDEPDENGGYCADTLPIIRPKFQKIITIHKENIRALKWL